MDGRARLVVLDAGLVASSLLRCNLGKPDLDEKLRLL